MSAREEIALALNDIGLGCAEYAPEDEESGCPDCMDLLRYADALTPLVDRLCAEAAAGELDAMARVFDADARHLEGGATYAHAAEDLRTHAALLRAERAA